MSSNADTDLPVLTIRPASSEHDLIAGYKLITDSIAQQRQTLNRAIISHPLSLSGAILVVAIVVRVNHSAGSHFATQMLLVAGAVVAMLGLVQRMTADYLEEAERLAKTETFEERVKGEGREMVVALWGDTVVGAVVMRGEELWAWTVMRKYRGNGLGGDLLQAAVARVRERKGADADIKFAEDHANRFRLQSMPAIFNKALDQEERRARAALAAIVPQQ